MAAPRKPLRVSTMLNVMERAKATQLAQYCFLLGSGASVTSGIPSGETLMRQWHDDLLNHGQDYIQGQAELAHYDWERDCKALFDPKGTLPNEAYFTLYDLRFAGLLTEGYQFLQNQMKGKSPSPGYYYLAKLLMETKNKLVITTNFDPMTEEALFDVQRVHPLLLSHESLAPYLKIDTKQPIVAKIHRDLLLDPMNRKEELQELKKQWKYPLTQVLRHYTPIVVGYAGGDQTLMTLLEELKEQLPGIFWCTLKGKELPPRARRILDMNPNGHWVEIDGFDELMFQIAQRLDCLPVSEELRQSAEERLDKFQKKDAELKLDNQSASTNMKTDETPQDTGMLQAVLQEAAKQAAKTGDPKATFYRHLAKAARFRSMGQLEAALEECNQAIRLQPNNAIAYNNRGAILYEMGRYEGALEDYDRAIQHQLDYAIAYNNRGNTLYEMDRYEEALEDMNHAIMLQPDNAKFYDSRGVTLHEMRRYEEALEDKNRAIQLQPNAQFYYNRGATLHEMNRYEEALEDCNRAVKLQPDNARFYDSRGVTLHQMGRYEEALEDQDHAIQLQPNAQFYYNHGATLHDMGRYGESLENKNYAIKLQPDNAEFYDSRGVTLHEMHRYEEALEDKNHAIKLQPDNARFYNSRAITLGTMSQYEEALEDHNHAIKLQPDNAKFYDSRSTTLHKMGRYEEALEDCNQAIKLQPDNATLYDSRAITLRAMGREDEAKADEERANALRNPKQP